jgi:hypothetical protein
MNQTTAKYIILIGGIVVLIGIIFYFWGDKLNWLGRLPGDIRYEGKNTKVYFPIVTMLLISVVLNVILYLIRKYF